MSRLEPELELHERERIVLETIRQNPTLHHNALLQLIVPKFMAKTTFEKTRNSLIDKKMIHVEIKQNMKFYRPTENFEHVSHQHIERNTTILFHDLKSQIRKLDTDFSHKDVDEKISLSKNLLYSLLLADNGFTILDSAKNPKKTLYRDEHLTIQQLMFKIFKIIRNDKDSSLIFPPIMSSLGMSLPYLQNK